MIPVGVGRTREEGEGGLEGGGEATRNQRVMHAIGDHYRAREPTNTQETGDASGGKVHSVPRDCKVVCVKKSHNFPDFECKGLISTADKKGVMNSTADLRCIQCYVNHMTSGAPNQNTPL